MDKTLEEARRRYPPGTTIISIQSGSKWTIAKDAKYTSIDGNIKCQIYDGKYNVYLKWNGIWSEIIKTGEPQINNQYDIY